MFMGINDGTEGHSIFSFFKCLLLPLAFGGDGLSQTGNSQVGDILIQ